MLGLALIKNRKSVNRAVELCTKAIQLESFNAEHRLRLGEIYFTMGSLSLAKQAYKEALRWDSSNIEARERLKSLGEGPQESKSFFLRLLKRFQGRKYY